MGHVTTAMSHDTNTCHHSNAASVRCRHVVVLIISCHRSEHLSCIAVLQTSSVAPFLSPFVSVHPQLETKNTKKVSRIAQ